LLEEHNFKAVSKQHKPLKTSGIIKRNLREQVTLLLILFKKPENNSEIDKDTFCCCYPDPIYGIRIIFMFIKQVVLHYNQSLTIAKIL